MNVLAYFLFKLYTYLWTVIVGYYENGKTMYTFYYLRKWIFRIKSIKNEKEKTQR